MSRSLLDPDGNPGCEMKKKPRGQDLVFVSVAALAVLACAYYPVPTWMLVFSSVVLVVVIIGLVGNLGVFGKHPEP